MRIARIKISNFRGIKDGEIYLNSHSVFVGDNNSGKSTILEAIDLVLGPERLSRYPIIDEHDFYAGEYIDILGVPQDINIEVVLTGLSLEQEIHFRNHLEWWSNSSLALINDPPPARTDSDSVASALRVCFRGYYDIEEDDFFGETFFASPMQSKESSENRLTTKDKRLCGFLYLRTLRTGTRALSLEHGSLLDVILKLKELKPQMWEDILLQLKDVSVASKPELGISDILKKIQDSVRDIVPIEWAEDPAIKVSQMTRDHLRQILTVFFGTGAKTSTDEKYSAPFHHQGTGTINTLVLALLSMIAELKKDVIFAMEEPEIAIPPYTQKRVIARITELSSQALFTSHSPYILEEYEPSQVIVISRMNGILTGVSANYPPNVKMKAYRDEIKKRFCEALLARRVLIVEGRTEYDNIPVIAKMLKKTNPVEYSTLGELGIAVINAESDTNVAPLGEYFRKLGKVTFAIFDKQTNSAIINKSIDYPYESPQEGFEILIIDHASESVLREYALSIVKEDCWPAHLSESKPSESFTRQQLTKALLLFFKHHKGDGKLSDLIEMFSINDLPEHICTALKEMHDIVEQKVNRQNVPFEVEVTTDDV